MIKLIYHLGARTDPTEFDFKVLDTLNVSYSKKLWEICTRFQNTTHLCLIRYYLRIGRTWILTIAIR